MTYTVIGIDPSVRSLGLGFFENGQFAGASTIKGLSAREPIERRVHGIVQAVCNATAARRAQADISHSVHIIIEQPQRFGAYKSAASLAAGDLQLLDFVVGGLLVGLATPRIQPQLAKVSTWKGNLSKQNTRKRLSRDLSLPSTTWQTHDECDATGIAWWYLKQLPEYQNDATRHAGVQPAAESASKEITGPEGT